MGFNLASGYEFTAIVRALGFELGTIFSFVGFLLSSFLGLIAKSTINVNIHTFSIMHINIRDLYPRLCAEFALRSLFHTLPRVRMIKLFITYQISILRTSISCAFYLNKIKKTHHT